MRMGRAAKRYSQQDAASPGFPVIPQAVGESNGVVVLTDDRASLMRPVDSTEHYDKLLVSRFVGGDASAFDEIVAAHKNALGRLVHRILGWPEDTEDIVQDVFLLAFKNLRKFDGRSSLRTWLAAIAVNRCRRHLRRGL